jgi:hypothetical protein
MNFAKISKKLELFRYIKKGLRPSIENDICSKEIIDLLKKCWSENVNERPEFSTIRDIMKKTYK